ncbi:hypothetical protein [Streptomyces ureilyticus]|uniref:Uncharacterized protein n=1 Tax=Streptomyces ureilyticus TaxID=1775131 RepID=A0ABX0DZE6_9ACTN|nr:hypothetical protein [Streptomyces ureilyticus]NGO47323.1 hypothetical protein [Streptomyces ureilyticus]
MEQNSETPRAIKALDSAERHAPTSEPPDNRTKLKWVDLTGKKGTYHAAGQRDDGSWFVQTWDKAKGWARDNSQALKDVAEIVGPHIVQATGRYASPNHPVPGAVLTGAGVTLEAGFASRRLYRYASSAVQTGSWKDWLKSIAAGIQVGTSVAGGISYLPNTPANTAYNSQATTNLGTAIGSTATGPTAASQQQVRSPTLPQSIPMTPMYTMTGALPTSSAPPSRTTSSYGGEHPAYPGQAQGNYSFNQTTPNTTYPTYPSNTSNTYYPNPNNTYGNTSTSNTSFLYPPGAGGGSGRGNRYGDSSTLPYTSGNSYNTQGPTNRGGRGSAPGGGGGR